MLLYGYNGKSVQRFHITCVITSLTWIIAGAGLVDISPLRLHRAPSLEGPALCLVLCCCYLEFHSCFSAEALSFSLYSGPYKLHR